MPFKLSRVPIPKAGFVSLDFFDLARARHSVRLYETGIEITDADLKQIFETVILGPSSFNVQHWKFVIVRDQARKRELRALAYGQQQVEQCSAAVLVCGRLDAHEDAPRIYRDEPDAVRAKYVPMIESVYRDESTLQREEAIRSGALAAMSLMYAAKARGWDTGPMIGFDAARVGTLLGLDAQTIPVMLVVIGKALAGQQPSRIYRRPVVEVVKLERLDGPGLA